MLGIYFGAKVVAGIAMFAATLAALALALALGVLMAFCALVVFAGEWIYRRVRAARA